MIEFNTPWLLFIAIQPLLILLIRKYFERNKIRHYVKKDLQPWVIVDNVKNNKVQRRNIAYYIAWILFAIAAAGPRIAAEETNDLRHVNKDIIVVLDISQSMQATDISPTRLRQAHNKIDYLINNTINARIGIVVFAGKPHLYVPLTYDRKALSFYLKNIKYLIPPSQGSQPLPALKLANQLLNKGSTLDTNKASAIVLVTDADTSEQENKQLALYFSNNNTPLYTLLVSSDNGEAVPAFKNGWLNIDGRPVISRPKTAFYEGISKKTNGQLIKSSSGDADILKIIDNINSLSIKSNSDTTNTHWDELFYIFLVPALLLIFTSMFPYTWKTTRFTKQRLLRTNLLLITLSIIVVTSSQVAYAARQADLKKAYQALIDGDYVKSRELYSSVHGFDGLLGEAVSSYRLADYPRAIRLFEQTVLLAESPSDFTSTLYNLGNSYFQLGDYASAVSSFNSALLYQPTHQASLKNRAYAKKALRAIEERGKLLAITSRAGKGPRSARAAKDIALADNNSVSLGGVESENTLPAKANEKIDMPEFIILKGLEFANTSSENKQTPNQDPRSQTNSTQLNQLTQLQDNQLLLWRRIFEIEEGYPAPLDEPEILPGVSPW